MVYSAEISRKNPGCLLFLIDQSGSMEGSFGGGAGTKKDCVADVLNRLLYNTVLRCAKEDGVRDYFHIGVFGYGVHNAVQRSFHKDLTPVSWIAEHQKRIEKRQKKVPDGAGGVIVQEIDFPIWFEPVADGGTPMYGAFQTVLPVVRSWVAAHPTTFPPIVINITDGAYTDQSPAPVAQEIMKLATQDGNVLVFNCHISGQTGSPVIFPDDGAAQKLEPLAKELYGFSSLLPDSMRSEGINKGYPIPEGARGFAFNADLVMLVDFIDIGTRVIQDRMEDV